MSELDVIVIHIRAEQAEEYERLFAERELPRWREYKARGAFISARISRVAFGTDDRADVVKYAIAVEVPPAGSVLVARRLDPQGRPGRPLSDFAGSPAKRFQFLRCAPRQS